MLTDQKVIDFFTNEMFLAKINGKEDTLLKQQHRVSGYPTLVMLDKNGEDVDRIVGYRPPEKFLKILRDYRNGIGTLADLLNQAKTKPDRSLAFEIANKYKYRDSSEDASTWYQKVIDAGDPRDSLSGESRFAIADMYRRAKEYYRALGAFSGIMKDFKGTSFAEDAEIERAIVYRKKADTISAIAAFEDFAKHYPESEDFDYAKKQIAKLKGKAEEKK